MQTVGIRELKTHLSRHLKRVRSGARLLVTEHGRSIATISPVDAPADVGWAHQLVAEGLARWNGGKPVGAAEINKKRIHQKGAVAMAHAGDPSLADSQIYVTLANRSDLNGKYTVFGQVIAGLDVTEKIQVGDVIRKMYLKRQS